MTSADAHPDHAPARRSPLATDGAAVNPDNDGGSASGVTLGEELRRRREELGWSLAEVAAGLRIREAYLAALEDNQIRALPGNAYAVGFLRSYAEALGLDAERAVRRFRRDAHGALDRKQELAFPQPVAERGIPVGLWIGAGLAVVVLTYIGYYHFSGGQVAPARPIPPASEIMPGVTARGTTSPQVASVMPDRDAAPSSPPPAQPPVTSATVPHTQGALESGAPGSGAVVPPQSGQTPVTAPATTGSTTPQPPVGPAANADASRAVPSTQVPPAPAASAISQPPAPESPVAAATAPMTPQIATSPAPLTSPPAAPGTITLHASADAWISARDQTGKIVLNRVLKAGETWDGPASGAPYQMTLGNAGGVTLSAGGAETRPLGKPGAVRRNVTVSAQSIADGSVLGDVSASKSAAPQLDQSTQPR